MLRDMGQALHYSLLSCDLGHSYGCANASRMYRLGDGVTRDEDKARTLKSRAEELREIYS